MDLLERHRHFWTCEPVDRPILGVSREGVFFLQPFLDLGVGEGMLPIEAVPSPEAFLQLDSAEILANDLLDGDLFRVAKPPRALPWMEAIVGCGVHVSVTSKTITATQPDARANLELLHLASNPWLRLMVAFTDALALRFADRFPVGQTLMRGPSDMMAALLGQAFYTELYENPGAMKRLARQCTGIWIQVLQIQNEHMPCYRGGYVSGLMGVWAPGPTAVYQEDAAGLISETMYREFFLECDAAIAAAFDNTLLHLHSASLHILEPVLEIPDLKAVNVVVDPMGPTLDKLIPSLQRIQHAHKALHLHGDLTDDQIELAKKSLSPNGLCIMIVRENR